VRPKRQEPDGHAQALRRAMERWETKGIGGNIFLCVNTARQEQINKAHVFLAGKYPVLSSNAMARVFLGNGPTGQGLGFYIDYIDAKDFVYMGFNQAKDTRSFIEVLPEAMLPHVLTHGQQVELNQFIAYHNGKITS